MAANTRRLWGWVVWCDMEDVGFAMRQKDPKEMLDKSVAGELSSDAGVPVGTWVAVKEP